MNLPVFLKEVDDLTSELSHDQLENFVHEIARTLPEGGRGHFLNTLKIFGNSSKKTGVKEAVRNDSREELLSDIRELTEKLVGINAGERWLDSEYNEEWDDWYNSDVDEILFMDSQGILKDINKAIDLVHRCVDMEVYKEGCELAEMLSALEVTAEGDYNDYDGSPLGLQELDEHELLTGKFEELVREALYLTYMGNALEDRAEELFCVMGNFGYNGVKLEDILQTGNQELPQFQEFLPKWIDYLGLQHGGNAKKLLEEAQSMVQDDSTLLQNARKYVDNHPELYEQFLVMKANSGEDGKMLHVGVEALEKIPDSYVVRSRIALLTADYACKMQETAMAEFCWKEAFRSDPSVVNYMRIRFLTRNWEKEKDDIRQIFEAIYKKTELAKSDTVRYYDAGAQEKNSLHKNEYCILLFFDGQFDKVLRIGMNEKKALGWSASFMKEGLSLYLLLLFAGEELPSGLKAMLSRVISACRFNAVDFYKGTGKEPDEMETRLFWHLFCKWKQEIQLPEDKVKNWLEKIERWIAVRVEGIMDANRRNYYGECASYIAAFGEVQESLGRRNAKAVIMEKYRSDYSRRRAFHQELKNYGL